MEGVEGMQKNMKRLAAILLTIYTPAAAAELAPYIVVNADAIPEPLIEVAPDPELGSALMLGAGCSACHQKDLNGIGERLSEGQMRLMIVAPELRIPGTSKPAYYSVGVYGAVAEDQVGETRLGAEEIEAIISYLKTL